MANKQIDMSKIRQILRMWSQGKSKYFITEQTGVARNTIKRYIRQMEEFNLDYEEINKLNDASLEELFGKEKKPEPSNKYKELEKCFPQMGKELKRKGMTRKKLWYEYIMNYPDGYSYSHFSHYLNTWINRVNPVMHMEHKAGDKMYVDFAGERLQIVDKDTGEIKELEVFVAILGASQLTYVEAVMSQKREDFISCCENAIHYFGGVPQAIVTDNLKSAVIKSDKYEPTLNETFEDFAEHYEIYVLPARAYRPKDKSLVEGAVKIIYNRIYTAMRDKIFHSVEEENEYIWKELEVHNNTNLTGRNYSRQQVFDEVEKQVLQPLPLLRYEFKKQQLLTVHKNCHICLSEDKHYYSVSYKYIGKRVKLLYSQGDVKIYFNSECVAEHHRDRAPYKYTTNPDHLASTHRFVTDWSPERFIEWAASIDNDVKAFIEKIFEKKQHPEQAYKSCVGILSLIKKFDKQRLIDACKRSMFFGVYNYKNIVNILENELDMIKDYDESPIQEMPLHENIRGIEYYQ